MVSKRALIIETLLSTGPLLTPPEKAVRACLEVRKINLSQAYELLDGTIVTGEILAMKGGGLTDKEKEIVKEIEGNRTYTMGICSWKCRLAVYFQKFLAYL